MSGIETIVMVSSLTSCAMIYSAVLATGYIQLLNDNHYPFKSKILLGLALPFYPIWVPTLLLHECICYRRNRETTTNIEPSGYEGFQERTDNIANEDNKASNTNEN